MGEIRILLTAALLASDKVGVLLLTPILVPSDVIAGLTILPIDSLTIFILSIPWKIS
jgi:hypothetical protein